jgi:hypothetical protein
MVAIAFSQRRSTVTKHCGNKQERSCLRRSRPSVAQFNDDRWQATEKATLPLLEGPSEPNVVCRDFTHTGYDNASRLTDEVFTDVGNLMADVDNYHTAFEYDLTGNRLTQTTITDTNHDGVLNAAVPILSVALMLEFTFIVSTDISELVAQGKLGDSARGSSAFSTAFLLAAMGFA